jgi:hypothetical protein
MIQILDHTQSDTILKISTSSVAKFFDFTGFKNETEIKKKSYIYDFATNEEKKILSKKNDLKTSSEFRSFFGKLKNIKFKRCL